MAVEYKVVRVTKATHSIAKQLSEKRDQTLIVYFANLVSADWRRVNYARKRAAKRKSKKGAK